VARVRQHAATGVLADATADEDFCNALINAVGAGRAFPTQRGQLRCTATGAFAGLRATHPDALPLVSTGARGANTLVRVGDAFFLKIRRRLQPGTDPGVQVGRYLTEVAHFPNTVPLAGFIEYQDADGSTSTLALVGAFVPNQGDGWDYTVNYLVRFLEERLTHAAQPDEPHGLYLALLGTLGTRTAELHATLAAATDAALAPAPIAAADLTRWRRAARAALTATLKMLAARAAQLPAAEAAQAAAVLAARNALLAIAAGVGNKAPRGLKIRCHGDYHLRQVMLRRNDFVITGFGDSPDESETEQQRLRSPLTDVASMLRSFAYARRMALQQGSLIPADERGRWEPELDAWEEQARGAFIAAYDETARERGLYASLADVAPLLRLFELQAACADLQRELLGRPDWAGVPLRRLAALAS
jgi:maltose alpha-D-glucosyltransferase / alpha-amylase